MGIFYYALKQREEFPFLLYGMYSLKEEAQNNYTAYSMVIDGREVNYSRLKEPQKELMISSLQHVIPFIEAGIQKSKEVEAYKEWLFRYSVDMRGLESNKMSVYTLTCAYNSAGNPQILKKELLYTYAAK